MGSPVAPPPSPVAGSRRESWVANDDVLTEFLRQSLHVPELVLPAGLQFPWADDDEELVVPSVDFQSPDASAEIRDALRSAGCFQLLNHGVPTHLIREALDVAAGVFLLPPKALPQPGFEEEDGDQFQFVWRGDDHGLRSQLQQLWPDGFSDFSEKMGSLSSAMKEIYIVIMQILNKVDDVKVPIHSQELYDSMCYINKHPATTYRPISSFNHDIMLETQCLEILPKPNVLIVTSGNQIQAWTCGQYKHAIGRPIYDLEHPHENSISMAFVYSPSTFPSQTFQNKTQGESIITLQQQALFLVMITIACQFLLFLCQKL